ncbi:flagellar assembly peptidoglycan hydrolase FlgJ [Saccharospirillum salsuginis]|uniref:Peptidoglycan hydrolase FlgJ n=1 Tax=Saccharospirillum salsuginis TaxID=418750 RepID=A0A918K6U6_9GAMM|nr:flagellar assembly peptidoglycan hydrolase FlgJ [Saccharospirillum salsuginis]GGX50573.1 peptidoglycan hydrolase FlgJ [Saccharospirillum salsuginis]
MVSQLDAAFNYNDLHGLNSVKQAARKDDPEALKVVAKQFESMFISMVLKSMREATDVMASDMLSSNETKFYRDMHDQQLSLSMAESGGYGLADTLYQQLSAQLPQRDRDFSNVDVKPLDESQRPILPASPVPEASEAKATESTIPDSFKAPDSQNAGEDDSGNFKSPQDFIESLLPHAREAAQQLGVAPRVLVAQAALETGWGRHMIQGEEGQPSFNFFGIKANHGWQGDVADTTTHEYIEGRRLTIKDRFRAYPDPASAFQDYVDFLKENPRYRDALDQAADPAAYTQGLQQAGYATDPNYADKILRIADSDLMQLASASSSTGSVA